MVVVKELTVDKNGGNNHPQYSRTQLATEEKNKKSNIKLKKIQLDQSI